MADIINPDKSVMTHNADVYWHYASDPVQRAQLLGTFTIGTPQKVLLPLPADADVVLRAVPRGGRGQTFMVGPGDATPVTVHVPGIGSSPGMTGEALQNEHVPVTPLRSTLNAELPFIQFRDEGDVSAKSQIRSRRTPTGAQNVVTDWNASGDGRIYQVVLTAGAVNIQIIAGAWFDSDVTWHPTPYWTEGAVPHSFRGGQGIRIFGAAGGADLYTTVTAVNGAIVTLAVAPDISANPGAACHDDTAALKAAFDNRGHIWIPEGRYWINQRLLWPATSTGLNQQIIIEGDGEWRSVLMFNHDGNGIQLVGSLQTGNPNSGVYDAVIRNLGIWCVPNDNKEGLRPTSKGHGLAFTATSSNSGVPGPSTGNVRVENVLLQGWGRWGLWSDNLQSTFLTNIKGYHNLSGAIALVGNATIRGTSQQEDNAIEITNSLVVYSGPNDFGLSGDSVRTLSGGSIAAWSRSLTVSGGLTANDVGRIVKLVDGPGVGGSTHVTMIESVQSSTACTISMPVWQAASGFAVIVYQSSVANVFLHNANNVRINGGTHQGNWVSHSGNAGGVRAENLDCLRIDGLWEEDAGGTAGAAIDLYNCRAVDIDSTHTGGSINPAGPPAGHGVGIRMTDVQGVTIRGCYIGQSGPGTAYATHGNSQGVIFENCYGADWIAGLANTDVAGEPVIIGPGCHSLSFDNVQTSTLALWDEQWTQAVVNPTFLDGLTGWSTPTSGTITQPGAPYTQLMARWERYLLVNSQALGSGLVDVLTQDIPIPDSRQSGQWTLSWDHYIQSRGAGGSSDNNTVVTIEVRTATAGYTVRSVTLTGDAGYGLPVGRWMRLCIKTNLDGGVTGRFFRIRFSNSGTANSPIFRIGNVRLQPGISATFDADQPITAERGGKVYAPIAFAPINTTQFPAPATGTDYLTLVNIGGVLNVGKLGVYSPIGTTGSPTAGSGTDLKLVRWAGTPPTQTLVDSNITDRTSLPVATPGAGTIEFLCNQVLMKRLDTSTDWMDFYIRSGFGISSIWRFMHDSAGLVDGANTRGEMQIKLDPENTSYFTWVALGNIHSYFNGGVRIRPPAGYTGGNAFEVRTSDDITSALAIDTAGNLVVIHGVIYSWPNPRGFTTGVRLLQSDASGTLTWVVPPAGSTNGHVIQDEGGPLTQKGALNFTGPGVLAFNHPTFDRTDVFIFTATVNGYHGGTADQEGTVSTGSQDFTGHKWFHRGIHAWDDAGGTAVPLVAQAGSLAAASSGAHIQEWWAGSMVAYLDTQPVLRLGSPGGSDGFLELCSVVAGSQTVKLACGIGATQAQTIRMPLTFPTVGNILQVDTAGGSNVNLKWSGAPAGHTIMEEGTPLIQRVNLNFVGAGFTAADVGGNTQVTLNAATATADGIVNTISQTYGGRKTFNQGATMIGLASLEPVLTCQLASGAVSSARLQEWRDVLGLNTLAYMDATPTFRLGSASFFTGQLDLCHASTTSVTSIRAAGTAAASYVYVLPANTPTNGQVLNVLSVSGSTVTLSWVTGGGGGANTALSNLTATAINASLDPDVTQSGLINLGNNATNKLWGSMHMKNGVFVFPSGSTNSTPRAFGFIPSATPGSTAECTRFLVYGDRNSLQSGDQYRTQISSYHGLELRGNRRSSTPPTYTNIPSNDSSGVIVYQESIDVLPLLVNSGIPLASDLFTCQNNFTTKFKIGAQGTIIAPLAGTQLGARGIQVDTTLSPATDRTLIIDTVSGSRTVTLPVASTCRGQIFDIIALRQIQVILNAANATGSGNTVTIAVQTPDSINAWAGAGLTWIMSNNPAKRAVKLIADSNYDIWWLVPYDI